MTDADEASTGVGVAVANLVHVVIALVVTAALARARRRDPAGLRRWLRTPFTQQGWRRLLDALVGLPLGLGETVLLAVGRRRRVAAIEDRRRASLGAGPADPGRLGDESSVVCRLRVVARWRRCRPHQPSGTM